MKKSYGSVRSSGVFWERCMPRRLCAVVLILSILFSLVPAALGADYNETYLSVYFADATMAEGKASKNAKQFFANIAAISMADLADQEFLTQLAGAVRNGYKYRVFVLHEKGMPATDLAMLYCFQDASWLLRDTTSVNQSVYLDASWEVLQGFSLKLQQKEIIRKVMPDCDAFYECDAGYVCQIYIEFMMFIEERNKAIQQLMDGVSAQVPDLPEEIEDWPLEIPVSVQLPAELTILDAVFTVEPAARAAATFEEIPASQRFEGVVGAENLVTGTLSFWEAGPHRVHLVFTASINGHRQSLSHEMSIDTSSVRVQEKEEKCPLHEEGHQWQYAWAEEHPHEGRFVCDCGAVMEDPSGATRLMLDCCKCYGHDWALSYFVSHQTGKGVAVGRCRCCDAYVDMTDRMTDYIRNYVELLAENGAEGNTYFEEHDTGDVPYSSETAPWVYLADQALNRYTKGSVVYKEAFVNTLAEPFVSTIQLLDGEYEQKISIKSKAQMLWIQLIQEMLTGYEQEVSAEAAKQVAEGLDIGIDGMVFAYDAETDWLNSIAQRLFDQSVLKLEEGVRAAKASLEALKRTTTDPARILMEEDKVNAALKELEDLKAKGPDGSLAKNTPGKVITKALPHIMNAISSVMEGMEAGAKVKKMQSAYIQMLNDYSRSREILDQLKADAAARDNRDLENAVDSIADVLDATYAANLREYFDATTQLMDSMGNELKTADETKLETTLITFGEKTVQTILMDFVAEPIAIASTAAKILKCVTNYDEIFDASTELSALSTMRQKASLSLLEYSDQVSPYTLALYAKLESEGSERAAEFVSTLSSESDIDNVVRKCIENTFVFTSPGTAAGLMLVDAMEVDVKEFGIGSDEKETVVLMLRKEKKAYDDYVRQCLEKAGNP